MRGLEDKVLEDARLPGLVWLGSFIQFLACAARHLKPKTVPFKVDHAARSFNKALDRLDGKGHTFQRYLMALRRCE